MAQAREANNDLAAAMARVREADAQARIAGAALLPAVGATASATRARQRVSGRPAAVGTLFSPQLAASYQLDFWGRERAIAEAAEDVARQSRYDRATVELSVMAGVAITYFEAVESRERLKVAEDNLASAETILEGLRLEATVGTATALDVAQQETTVASLSAAIPPLRLQVRQFTDALAILIGQPPAAVEVHGGDLADLARPVITPGLPSGLLARRPDIAAAEAQLMAANADITVARAAFFPSITLTASGGYASRDLATLFNPSSRLFSLGAGLTQPIFEGGALEGGLAFSHARYDELVALYRKAVITAFGNVEDALAATAQTADQEARQQAAAETARHAYEIAQEQLRAGVLNVLTVLNTENAYFTAQQALAQAKFFHLQAIVNLFSALGGGWETSHEGRG